jgi:hypothetical protein
MAAALKEAAFAGGTIGAGSSNNGTGIVEGLYTVTTATTLDWAILADFSEILFIEGYVTSTGVDCVPYVDGTTENKVFVTGVGACTLLVKGVKA